MTQFLISDCVGSAMLALEESTKTGNIKFRGKFQEANAVNKNKRIYPEAVLRREVDRLAETIQARASLGELDHPSDSIVHLENVSHITTKLWWEGNVLMGEGEVLPTPAGNVLKKLIESGIRIGISSRGVGNGEPNKDGVLVIGESYKLITFDAVADPSTYEAFQKQITSKDENVNIKNLVINSTKNESTSVNTINVGALISYVGLTLRQKKDDLRERLK